MARRINDGVEVLGTEREVDTIDGAANAGRELLDGFRASGAALCHDALDPFGRVRSFDQVLGHCCVLSLDRATVNTGRSLPSHQEPESSTKVTLTGAVSDRTLPTVDAEGAS